VVDMRRQVWAGVLPRGPDGRVLTGTFKEVDTVRGVVGGLGVGGWVALGMVGRVCRLIGWSAAYKRVKPVERIR